MQYFGGMIMGTDLLTLAEAQIAEKQYNEIKAVK